MSTIREPQDISPDRAQRILTDLLRSICDIASEVGVEEMTTLEKNLLYQYTSPVEKLETLLSPRE